jgi:murein DD-endopeptidase MepM/ murein hydrolase activator NlpD
MTSEDMKRQAESLSPTENNENDPGAGADVSSRIGLMARIGDSVRRYWAGSTPTRLATHGVVILVIGFIIVVSRAELPQWELPLPKPTADSSSGQVTNLDLDLPVVSYWPSTGGSQLGSGQALSRSPVPFTVIPDRPRLNIITHTVKSGDTLSGIALDYELALNTVMWASGLELCPQLLRVGQQLMILPVDGVQHTIEEGDNLQDIAGRYRVAPEIIVAWEPNRLESSETTLVPGEVLIVPGGIKEKISTTFAVSTAGEYEPSAVGTGRFAWPLSGRISILDWFGTQTLGGALGAAPRPWPHKGVDLVAWLGTPILATDSGRVTVVRFGGYNGGYGNYMVIDHGNGFSSLYAHLSSVAVEQGDIVAKGERIAAAGSTGMATGPHLHFEIRYNSVHRNPLCFLSMAGQ